MRIWGAGRGRRRHRRRVTRRFVADHGAARSRGLPRGRCRSSDPMPATPIATRATPRATPARRGAADASHAHGGHVSNADTGVYQAADARPSRFPAPG